ncbi:NAD-dependent protein deacetylase hst4 [Penicillium taxi]|uniref:NAD-dependent protein deacetylase hst4 n=1 Tax=Penicillium taxi TaxID=168475 RepID=UPI0025456667|nr:NAD-dependent protein deacetylase hst4 [Penicillium taxi]KAJ5893976.1 NAD-dependent protein deacetylase hst4 [Penicillium taxi]
MNSYYEVSDIGSDLSSAPSSTRSSPEPVPASERYPTPSSQISHEAEAGEDSTRQDCPPAKKRRRNPLPKERITQYLDFSKSSYLQSDQTQLLVDTLRYQKDIVVIAGAGISTSAGIPDFRSADGLFKTLQKKHNLKASGKLLFDVAVYQDEKLTAPFHELVRSLSLETAKTKPSPFHHMLARLGKEKRLKRLYTQNIDGIETSMKPLETEIPLHNSNGWPTTIQLHGSIQKMVCQKCRYLCDLKPERFDQADPPDCDECSQVDDCRTTLGQRSHGVGRMRPRIVLYNEHNPDEEAITAVMNSDVKSRPRVLVVAGTSLKIPGVRRLVKSMCSTIRSRKDGVTIFINNEPPVGKEFENCFDLIVQGSTDDVANLVQLKNWEDNTPYSMLPDPVFGPMRDSSEQSETQIDTKSGIAVIISTPRKRPCSDTGLITPTSSDEIGPPKKMAATGKLSNPASRGRNLNDVLKGVKSKTAPKPRKKLAAADAAPKKRATKTAPKPATAKITTFSKVTKSTKAAATTDKKTAVEVKLPAVLSRNVVGL